MKWIFALNKAVKPLKCNRKEKIKLVLRIGKQSSANIRKDILGGPKSRRSIWHFCIVRKYFHFYLEKSLITEDGFRNTWKLSVTYLRLLIYRLDGLWFNPFFLFHFWLLAFSDWVLLLLDTKFGQNRLFCYSINGYLGLGLDHFDLEDTKKLHYYSWYSLMETIWHFFCCDLWSF